MFRSLWYSCAVTCTLITTELGRAPAVVKVTSQVNGNNQFSGSHHSKTISARNLAQLITSVKKTNNPHFITIGLLEASPHMGEIQPF